LAAAVASEHLEKLADQKHLETMPRITEVSRVIAKSALIYPVAFFMHAYALLALPFSVSAALFRSLAGVSGKGMDELFASQFAPGGAGESDTALLRGLREKHKLAMAALHDQLDDSDSRYKVRSARALSIAFSSRRIASSPPKRHDARRSTLVSRFSFSAKNGEHFSFFSLRPRRSRHSHRSFRRDIAHHADRVREAPRVRAHAQQDAAQAHRGAGGADPVRQRRARVAAGEPRAISRRLVRRERERRPRARRGGRG
jgi:hypothetical protein